MPRPGSKFSATGSARPGNAERSRRDQFKPRQSNLPGSRAPSTPRTTSAPLPSSQNSNGIYKGAYSGASRDSITGSLDSARRALQSHTIHSKSSRKHEVKKVPQQFRRDMTPNTRKFLDTTYFIRHKSSDQFKDVKQNGLCIRCAGKRLGRNAKLIGTPAIILVGFVPIRTIP